MSTILAEKYSRLLKLAEENATPRQMQDVFTEMGVTGSTLRKAVTFFIKACDFAEVKVPPNWSRLPSPTPTKGETPRKARKKAKAGATDPAGEASGQAGEDVDSLELNSGGTVTLSVSANMMQMSPEDREWLFGLIDQFKSYSGDGDGRKAEDE